MVLYDTYVVLLYRFVRKIMHWPYKMNVPKRDMVDIGIICPSYA